MELIGLFPFSFQFFTRLAAVLAEELGYLGMTIAIAVTINATKHAAQNIDQMAERRPSSLRTPKP